MGERFTIDELRRYLRQECAEAGGVHRWAQENGIDGRHGHNVINGLRGPGTKLLLILGLRKVTLYEDVGFVTPVIATRAANDR